MARLKAGRGIQKDLTIPGDEGLRPRVPPSLRKILEPLCEAIYNAATHKQQENEYKDQARELMAKHGLSKLDLPNGGSLLYKPGKASVQYVPAKQSAAASNGDSGESDEE